MSGLIPDSFIDELLARVDIVGLIGRYVTLKKAGHEWIAGCPFHDERTPSFYVSPTKQFYHCFGCGAHGSAIRFLMDYEHLAFPDAVEELAQAIGLPMPPRTGVGGRTGEEKAELYAILDACARWYQGQLAQNREVKAYCQQRGLDEEVVAHFRLGWAPARYDGILKALGSNGHRLSLLAKTGMLTSHPRGHRYDRFRDRLMFPIVDQRGRVIAFGGRTIPSAGEVIQTPEAHNIPKYLNSPDTPLFLKGQALFALWQVKQANPKLTRLLVVEGYMDAITLHQADLPMAVATLGTATTPRQAGLLLRTASDVVFCFDGDHAGRIAARKALEAVLPQLSDGRQVFFLFLPEGEDPDTLVRKEGKEGFERRLANATALSDYFFTELMCHADTRSLAGRARLAERARPLLARMPEGTFRELMTDELEKRTGARAVMSSTRAGQRHPVPSSGTLPRSLIRHAIALLLAQPGLANEVPRPYRFQRLNKPGMALLVELIDTARARPQINPAVLVEHFSGKTEYTALKKLLTVHMVGKAQTQRIEFHDALHRMEQQAIALRCHTLQAKMCEGRLDATEKNELRELLAARTNRVDLP